MLGRRPPVAAPWARALVLVAIVVTGCAAPEDSAASPLRVSPSSDVAAPPGPSGSGPDRPFRPTPGPAPTFATYVVRRGDTLLGLAARFATTAQSLAYWNRARYPTLDPESAAYAPDRIEAGWTLAYLPGQVVDPESPPPAAASPGPPASAEPFPVLPGDGSALLATHGPRGTRAVALTFDYLGGAGAGASTAGGADAVVQWLVATGVPATVFVAPTAADPADQAGQAVLARLAASRPGVTAGLLLAGPDPGRPWDTALRAADARLAPRIGRSTAPWLRVPGSPDPAALGVIGRAGWSWVVAHEVDPGDGIVPAAGGPIATDIAARVISQSSGGSIVRLTLGGAHTLEALPAILDGLAARGLRVVSLAELLGAATP